MMILKGDCFELIKKIYNKSIDLILVDPPYQISKSSNFKNYSKSASKDVITKYGNISILLSKSYFLKVPSSSIITYDV